MGKAYSVDLRLRVLRAIDGGMSKLCAHHTFQVSRTTIDDWLRLREETGSLAVKAPLPSGRPAIRDLVAFEEFAKRHSDSTLSQMAVAWEAQSGQKLSINTFSLTLRRIGWTRKKRASSTPSAIHKDGRSSCSS